MTDKEINELIGTWFEGFTRAPEGSTCLFMWAPGHINTVNAQWQNKDGDFFPDESVPDYVNNANAVLKVLSGYDWSAEQIGSDKIYVRLLVKSTENTNQQLFRASSKTFSRAACDVLLQSKDLKLPDQPL